MEYPTFRSLIEQRSAQQFDENGDETPGWQSNPRTIEIQAEIELQTGKVIQLIKSLRMVSCIILRDNEDWDNYRRIDLEKAAWDFNLDHVDQITMADIPDDLPIGPEHHVQALDMFLDHIGSQVYEIEITNLETVQTFAPTFIKYEFNYTKTAFIGNKLTLRTTQYIGNFDALDPDNTHGWTHWYNLN